MKPILKKITAALCMTACVLTASPVVYADSNEEKELPASTDWMAELSDESSLSSITIPGTHDSATAHIFPSFFLQCQKLEFAQQLEAGYRYLDIRVALEETENGDNKLKFIHNFGTCKQKGSFLQLFSKSLTTL